MGKLEDWGRTVKDSFRHPMRHTMHAWLLDVFSVGIIFAVVAMIFLLFAYVWAAPGGFRQNVLSTANSVNLNTTQYNQIKNFGNGYFLYSSDTILIFFYFMLIIATFISASNEAADPQSLPLGLPILVLAILMSMPISDYAHAFITSPYFSSVAVWFKGTLYILDSLPVFTGLGTLAYLVFSVTKRGGGGEVRVNTG